MTNHIHDIPQVVGRPAGYVNDATGTQHVVYRGDAEFNVINEVRWDGTGLHYTNLNLAAGTRAGAATGSGDPAAYVFRAQGTEHVVYRGFDNHVHELRKDASGWHHGDLTAMTGAPAAAGWNQGDLTVAAGSPPAAGDPGAYAFRAEGTQHVVYRTADGHLHEMWWRPGPGNHDGDLTIAARPPKPNAPFGLAVIRFTNPAFQHVQFDQSAGADGRFVSRHSIANVSSGEEITITAWEDADPDGTSANPIVTTCP